MPLLVEDVARAALGDIDTDAGLLRCVRWASQRYRELTNRARFRHLRRIGELNVEAPITTGLATVTQGSATVTGNAAASAVWTPDLVGRFFRAQVTWYEIVNVKPNASAATLTLNSEYAESPSATQPTGYRIVQQHVPLDTHVRYVGDFVLMRRRRRLTPKSLIELNQMYPGRNNITNGPRLVTEVGLNTEGQKIVEFYPYSDQQESIRYVYWPKSDDVGVGDQLPDEIDLVALKAGVMVDITRYESAKAARMGQMDKATFYANMQATAKAEWEAQIVHMIRSDKGIDDVTFILKSGRADMGYDDPLITTAHDSVYARWPV